MDAGQFQVVVIGGGAAGFFGAIACAQAAPRGRVTILDAGGEPLAKVRISGGGRCNVTNACVEPAELVKHYPRGGRALGGPFARFGPRQTIAWFHEHGVRLKTEPDGRVFPAANRAAAVVDCLLAQARAAGVQLRTGAEVISVARSASEKGTSLIPEPDQPDAENPTRRLPRRTPPSARAEIKDVPLFEATVRGGEKIRGHRVLLATGGDARSFALAAGLGHTIVPPVPSLFSLAVADERLDGLAGVSAERVRLRLVGSTLEQTGPLLITHFGLSGPAVLRLSAWAARVLHDLDYRAELLIDWLAGLDQQSLRRRLLDARSAQPNRSVASACPFAQGQSPLPGRVWARLVAAAGVADDTRWAGLSNRQLHDLIGQLSRGRFRIRGRGPFKDEFVTCGGVRLNEVDLATMASRVCPGLFLAGEVLDIDGLTGGFNLQAAWTTGYLAGRGLAASLMV